MVLEGPLLFIPSNIDKCGVPRACAGTICRSSNQLMTGSDRGFRKAGKATTRSTMTEHAPTGPHVRVSYVVLAWNALRTMPRQTTYTETWPKCSRCETVVISIRIMVGADTWTHLSDSRRKAPAPAPWRAYSLHDVQTMGTIIERTEAGSSGMASTTHSVHTMVHTTKLRQSIFMGGISGHVKTY